MGASRTVDVDRLAALALAGLAVTVPLATTRVLNTAHPMAFDSTEWTGVDLFDVTLLVLLGVWVFKRGPQRLFLEGTPWTRGLAIATAVLSLLSFAFHPSSHGLEMWLRGVAVVATVDAARQLGDTHRRWFLLAMVGGGVAQALLGIIQSFRGEKLGIEIVEYRYQSRLFPFGGDFAGQGSFFHPYLLAGYLLVAVGAFVVLTNRREVARPRDAVVPVVLATGIALTFSRSALLGLLIGVVFLVATSFRDRRMLVAAVALCIGVGVGGTLGIDGWRTRGATTTATTGSPDSGRRERAAEALRLIDDSPVVGIGLGRYSTALREVDHDQLRHSHNPVLHMSAEAGIPAGVLTAVLLGAGALWAVRAGALSTVTMLLNAPFWIIDAYGVVFPVGVAVAGLWMAVIVVGARARRPAPDDRVAVAPG